jgi:hypothetical protein
MDIATGFLHVVASLTHLVDRFAGDGFDRVVLAFDNQRGRVAQVLVEMAVGVGCPLAQEIDGAGGGGRAQNPDRIIDGVIETGIRAKVHPFTGSVIGRGIER